MDTEDILFRFKTTYETRDRAEGALALARQYVERLEALFEPRAWETRSVPRYKVAAWAACWNATVKGLDGIIEDIDKFLEKLVKAHSTLNVLEKCDMVSSDSENEVPLAENTLQQCRDQADALCVHAKGLEQSMLEDIDL